MGNVQNCDIYIVMYCCTLETEMLQVSDEHEVITKGATQQNSSAKLNVCEAKTGDAINSRTMCIVWDHQREASNTSD
jgi:hypothetical protein